MHLGLIGYGNIARGLIPVLAQEGAAPARLTVLAQPGREAAAQAALPGAEVVTEVAALIAAAPDLVAECAGQGAVAAHLPAVLAAGIDTVVASIGALADAALHDAATEAARRGGARMILPAGAVGGIDILAALRPSGIASVTYTGRKPPRAWAGTPAEGLLDLAALTDEAVFFSGTAREAALQYPKNANVAATVALAGAGLEATRVRLIADPAISANVHEIAVQAGAAEFTIRITGHPSPDNPKTSLTTVYSVAREILNRSREVAI
ncbi:MAG: aspartate dehydrogenase [Rhodobacter sp.]|nr:aspartate dehydrogenase [Paracoccaceae bacterium]MCC0075234.1 aspartate dehydrogenase [Rhodobacter sp.]